MLVNEFGIVTDVKPEQPAKALKPILVTEFGIVTDVKPEQPSKEPSPMLVTVQLKQVLDTEAGIIIGPLAPELLPTATVVGEVTT